MKKLLPFIFLFFCMHAGYSESLPADEILAFVRAKLPDSPLRLTGSLKIKAPNGFTKDNLPVTMELDWGAAEPVAKYNIGKESLTVKWNNDVPDYQFSNPNHKPTDDILGSGVNWADLSFSVLWWPNAKLVDEGKKLDRACYIVEVPVPDSENTMRLWIEKKMGMLLESHTLDDRRQPLRRVKIKSIKKMDGIWIGSDLEIKNMVTGSKTDLIVKDLERQNPRRAPVTAFDAAESVNRLAVDLYEKLAAENDNNLILSPYGITSALAMTYGGARGATETEMRNTLHYGGQGATHPALSFLRKTLDEIQNKGDVQLSTANSLWPQQDYTFLPGYLTMTKEFYGSEITPVDFLSDAERARQKINQWVEAQTMDRIKNLIPQGAVDSLTRLVLANAIYFKGNWASQFDGEATRPAPFTLSDGAKIEVSMMSQTTEFNYARSKDFHALELPYAGEDLSMLVFQQLTPGGAAKWDMPFNSDVLQELEFKRKEVMVQLPRFKVESSFGLADTLATMGMPLAFDMNNADFSGMDGGRELYIGSIFHKAFVEVNEEGTEAAAATAVVMKSYSAPPAFIANHPFLFLIRENSTGTILFIGRVMDPSK